MKEMNVVVYKKSHRDIKYGDLLGFYTHEVHMTEATFWSGGHLSDDQVVYVLDFKVIDDMIDSANRLREMKPYAAMVLLIEAGSKIDYHDTVQRIHGLGRILTASFYGEGFQLTPYLDQILHPQNQWQKSETAIVIPVFNETERMAYVASMVTKLSELIEKGRHSVSINIIDDGSSDSTVEHVQQLMASHYGEMDTVYWEQPFNLHCLTVNTKKAGTYIEAFSQIDADYILTIDADDSFDMEDVVKMIHLIKIGYFDIVVASKDGSTESRNLARRLISAAKRSITAGFLPKGVTDSQTGLKIFRRSAIQLMLPYLEMTYGLALDLEMLYLAKRMRLRTKQASVNIIDREGSHINIISDTARFIVSMIKMTWRQDYRKLV